MNTEQKRHLAKSRHWRVRKKVFGTQTRPRMSVRFSNHHIYVQFVDDSCGRTIVGFGTLDRSIALPKVGANVHNATVIGAYAGQIATKAGITSIVFDRGSAKYHGKVKALADAARQAGLKF